MGLLVNTMRTEEKMNETQIREQIENLRHSEVMSEAQFHTRIHIACTLKLAQTPGPVQGGAVD